MAAKSGARLRVITLASASTLALSIGGVAWAQSPSGGTGGPGMTPPPSAQSTPQPPRPVADPLTGEDVSKIKGAAVYGNDNKQIGTISTVLMKPSSKTIDRLVVGQGGMLGMGTHYVAVPINAFTWDSQAAGFKLAKTAEDLKAMPEWHEQVGAMPSSGNAPAETPSSTTPSSGGSSTLPPPGAEQRTPVPPNADRP